MRIKELQKILVRNKVDGALIFSQDPNLFYFLQEKLENGFLLIPVKGRPIVFFSRIDDVKSRFKKVVYENPYKDLESFIKKLRIRVLGVNESSITVKVKKKISKFAKTKNIETILTDLRKLKTDEEISKLKKACLITEGILKKIVRDFNFKTEKELRNFIKIESLKNDCEISFEPIASSGKNASLPHYFGNSRIKKGFLVIDFGMRYQGYCADLTRTFYIGNPSKKEIDSYNELLRIQKSVIKKIRPGVKVKELALYVRSEMGSEERYFTHGLGHGVGVKIHEAPNVSVKSDEVLERGMVITIEPGIYRKSGMRIEDVVLVTARGCRLLTRFPKQLVIIPKV